MVDLMTPILIASIALVLVVAGEGETKLARVSNPVTAQPHDYEEQYDALQAFLKKEETVGSELNLVNPRALGYCTFAMVECSSKGDIIGMTLKGVRGELNFQAAPRHLKELRVEGGKLDQAPDFTKLAMGFRKIKLRGIQFMESSELSLPTRHGHLRSFACRRCRLHAVKWAKMPPLASLDLSSNQDLALGNDDVPLLPRTLTYLNLSFCGLMISAETLSSLPAVLSTLDLSHNHIQGAFHEKGLPPQLVDLDLSHNYINGAVWTELAAFPSSLVSVDLSNNKFASPSEGALDFTEFSSLEKLNMSNNQIPDVHMKTLTVTALDASHNLIFLKDLVPEIPHSVEHLDLNHNIIAGSLDLTSLPSQLEFLDVSFNHITGTINCNHFAKAIKTVRVNNNKITGPFPDLTNLPATMREMTVGPNNFAPNFPPDPANSGDL